MGSDEEKKETCEHSLNIQWSSKKCNIGYNDFPKNVTPLKKFIFGNLIFFLFLYTISLIVSDRHRTNKSRNFQKWAWTRVRNPSDLRPFIRMPDGAIFEGRMDGWMPSGWPFGPIFQKSRIFEFFLIFFRFFQNFLNFFKFF